MGFRSVLQFVPEGRGDPGEGMSGDQEGGGHILARPILLVLQMSGSPPDLLLQELGFLALSAKYQVGQNGCRDGGGGDLRDEAPVQVQFGNVNNVENKLLLVDPPVVRHHFLPHSSFIKLVLCWEEDGISSALLFDYPSSLLPINLETKTINTSTREPKLYVVKVNI